MNVTPEITFDGVRRSRWVEDYIRERLQHLERFAGGIVSAHATLKREQTSHHKGNVYSFVLDLRLPPGKDIAAGKQRNVGNMQVQLRPLIRQVFEAAGRQLARTASTRRHEVKTHNEQPRALVAALFPEEGYGFLRTLEDNREIYFHRNSVLHDDFDRLSVGTEVRFNPEMGEDGPQASSLQMLSKPGVSSSPPGE